jgi:hypothetical protein
MEITRTTIFNANVSGETHDAMLNEVLEPHFDDTPLATHRRFWFQLIVAPARFALITREWLDSKTP